MPDKLIFDQNGESDDFFSDSPQHVHIERMDENHVWMSVTDSKGVIHPFDSVAHGQVRVSRLDTGADCHRRVGGFFVGCANGTR